MEGSSGRIMPASERVGDLGDGSPEDAGKTVAVMTR